VREEFFQIVKTTMQTSNGTAHEPVNDQSDLAVSVLPQADDKRVQRLS